MPGSESSRTLHESAPSSGPSRADPSGREDDWLALVASPEPAEELPGWLTDPAGTDLHESDPPLELRVAEAREGLKQGSASTSVSAVAVPDAYTLGDDPGTSVVVRLRLRRVIALLAILAAIAALTAVGVERLSSETQLPAVALPEPTDHLLPGTAPEPQILALYENLRLFLPIAPERVTAIGYRGSGADALPLDPFGTLANPGILVDLKNKIFGGGPDQAVRYYLIEGGAGPQTGGIDIGAPVGTNTYAPVDGTVLSISPVVIGGERFGDRVDLQPTSSPNLVVTVTNLRVAPSLQTGATVTASETVMGRLVDVSTVEDAALAEFTQDSGHHVHIELLPAANVALP